MIFFHHGACWLRLELDLLTDGHPFTSFSGWLRFDFDAAKPWDAESPVFFTSSPGHGA